MSQQTQPRYMIDPYLEWIAAEGVPVVEDYAIDLFSVATADWPRFGVKGAAVHAKARGDFTSMLLLDIPPAKSTAPQRHLFEAIVYVLEGSGSTQLEFGDGQKRSFEWGPHSLFAIPLNAKYRHFNASGRERALMVNTTNLPLVMNTFMNERFVFGSDFDFIERMGKTAYYSGEGEMAALKRAWIWETNFVPDLVNKELEGLAIRGKGARGIIFQLAEGMMHAHLSEIPIGAYKKGHRHPGGTHVMCVTGTGYSLLWFEGDQDFMRVDWKHGLVFPPDDRQFHQHFNLSTQPSRYLATRVGSMRYPFTRARRKSSGGLNDKDAATGTLSVKQGGDQIEYEDQDPRIHPIYAAEMKKRGLTVTPDLAKLFPGG